METTKTYQIPEENLYRLNKIFAKLQKRAVRLSQPEPGFEIVGEKLVESVNPETKQVSYYKVFEVSVFGVSPIIAGWQFYAVISTEEVGNVISPLPGISENDVPAKFRHSGSVCEHCEKPRNRNQTFLVRNVETGIFKQVGSTCLHDFTGYIAPETAAKYAEFVAAASEEIGDCEDFDGGSCGGYTRYFSPVDFLSLVVAIAEKYGFVTKKNAGYGKAATAEIAFSEITVKSDVYRKIFPTDEQKETAKKVWDWASEYYEHEENQQSDFGWNYFVITQKETIGSKEFGRTAYLYVAYNNYLEQKARSEKSAGYIGEVGKKVEFVGKIVSSKLFSSNYHYSTWLVKFQTEEGANVTWFASGEPPIKEGETIKVIGTVKEHNDRYNSTTVTRCKLFNI